MEIIKPSDLKRAAQVLLKGEPRMDRDLLLDRLGFADSISCEGIRHRRAILLLEAARAEAAFFWQSETAPGAAFAGMLGTWAQVGCRRVGEMSGGRGWCKGQAFLAAAGELIERQVIQRYASDCGDQRPAPVPSLSIGLEEREWMADEVHGPDPQAPISNGCAAQFDRARAGVSAIWELIERDAAALWWEAGVQARRLDESWLERAGLASLRQGAKHPRQTRMLALQAIGDLPVCAAISADPDGSHVVIGHGAARSWREAASTALLEMVQMELAEQILDIKRRMHPDGPLSAAEERKLVRRTALDFQGMERLGSTAEPWEPSRDVMIDIDDAAETLLPLATHVGGVALFELQGPYDPVFVLRAVAPALQPWPIWRETGRLRAARQESKNDNTPPASLY